MALTPEVVLKQYWQYDRFRPLQKEIIQSVLDGKDTVALLPTGGGKSLCYQVPALIVEGCTLVISPLIALMQDQVLRLEKQGISATAIYAGMPYAEVKQKLTALQHDEYKLLYLSPERLHTRLFKDYLPELPVGLIAVDEAHCIAQWGHDFRPDYLRISMLRKEFPKVPVLALTASATILVQEDIMKQLEMKKPAIFRQSFLRTNLSYRVQYTEQKTTETVRCLSHVEESSILYCRSRKQTELLSRQLLQQQIPALYYHAGLGKEQRLSVQQDWMSDKVRNISATTAFGMGIDKPDVRLVLHYDAPEHLEAWYQEAGRAGRDGKPADAVTLYNQVDISRLQQSTELQFPKEAYLRKVYQSVCEYLQIPVSASPDRYFSFDLADFCTKFQLDALVTTYALRLLSREGLWTISDAVFHPATAQFTTDRETFENIYRHHPDVEWFCTRLLRLYGSIFQYPVTIRESALAAQMKMSKAQVVQLLRKLHIMEVLQYNPATEGPQLFFHHYRVHSQHLHINTRRIALLRSKHQERTDAMIAFLQNSTVCRNKMLLTYFGEKAVHNCGICDVCKANNPAVVDVKAIEMQVLELLALHQSIKTGKLLTLLPATDRQIIINIVRKLADEQFIVLQPDGTLRKK